MSKLTAKSRPLSFASNVLHHRADRYIFVAEPTSGTTARLKGSLYVVAETDGDSAIDRAFCRLAADHIRNEYYKDSTRTPAAALRAALAVAARKIHVDERNPDDASRPVAGISCVVVCDGTVVVAQSLPVQVYLRTAHRLTLVPDPPPWEQDLGALTPDRFIGFRDTLTIDLVEERVDNGDMILVCSSSLAQGLSRQRAERTLSRHDLGAVAQELRALYPESEPPAYGLIVQVIPDNREDVATDRTASPDEHIPDVFSRLRTPTASARPPTNGREEAPVGARSPAVQRTGARETQTRPSSGLAAPTTRTRTGSLPPPQPLPPLRPLDRDLTRARVPVSSDRGRSLLANRDVWLGALRSRVALGLLTVVLLIGVGFGIAREVHNLRVNQQQQAAQKVVDSLKQQVAAADQVSDAPAKLGKLRQALQTTQNSQQTIPAADYATLSTSIQGKIDQVEQLAHFASLQTVGDFSGEKQIAFSRVLVDGDIIYALDQNAHRIAVLALSGGKPAFPLAPGAKAGTDVVGNVTAITLAPTGLFALDDRHVLWLYDKTKKELSRVKVTGSENWQEPRSMVTQGDKLLVVDAKQNRIFQYTMSGTTFGPATDYLAPAPAGQAPDLAHSSDVTADATSVFVLLADGSVLKFTKGERASFPESGLAETIVSPSGIFANGRDAAIYVADPSNRRVVKFAKDGRFLQQLRLPDDQSKLGTVQALYVDEAQNRAVLATEASLSLASLGAP